MTTLESHAGPSASSTETFRPRRTLRSVGAVLAGLVATIALTTAVDQVFHVTGVFPPWGESMADSLFVLALAYRVPLNAGGCAIAARLAPANPMRHALALGAVGFLLATLGAVTMGDLGPTWYALANIAIALPCAWLGGRLARRAGRPSNTPK